MAFFSKNTPSAREPAVEHGEAHRHLCLRRMLLAAFSSETKFESGTGVAEFLRFLAGALGTRKDMSLIWPRTEYHCVRCGGHQGHVFDDGPKPTGLRYCNNGVALRFIRRKKSFRRCELERMGIAASSGMYKCIDVCADWIRFDQSPHAELG